MESAGDWRHLIADIGQEDARYAACALTALGGSYASSLLSSAAAQGGCMSMAELDISGEDLKALGFNGRSIGETMNKLLHHVVDEPGKNQKKILL